MDTRVPRSTRLILPGRSDPLKEKRLYGISRLATRRMANEDFARIEKSAPFGSRKSDRQIPQDAI